MPLRTLLVFGALIVTGTLAFATDRRPLSTENWPAKRQAILAAAQEIMGPLPGEEKRCPLNVRVENETDEGTYIRRFISYGSEPGDRTPAWLLIPKSALAGQPAPGALCLHPTDAKIGHDVVVGLGGKANRAYAKELAERGYVTIAPSYPLLARYNPDLKALGWASGTMKAIWNHIRALDLLDEMSEVRHGRYGAIGHSLGGHNAIFAAVFDPRIQVVATSSGFDSFQDYYSGKPKVWEYGQGWCQDRYMPRLASYAGRLAEIPFDFHELLAVIAPRPVFINAPLQDSNFQHDSVDRIVAAVRRIYQVQGGADNVHVMHPDCPHDFPEEARQAAYALFDKVLQ